MIVNILRILLSVGYTYGCSFIVAKCFAYGSPNWWSFPTVMFLLISIIIMWALVILKWKTKN